MENKTFIICVDLGHCETAVTTIEEKIDGGYKVTALQTEDSKNNIVPSQLVLTNSQMFQLKDNPRPDSSLLENLGEIKIGSNLPSTVKDGEKFSYFKVSPDNFDKPYGNSQVARECGITHGMLMSCYTYALIENVIKFNEIELNGATRENIHFKVGCPSSEEWTSEKNRSLYAELLKNATGVKSVEIIPESRAAMFSALESQSNTVSAQSGAIVFDFGSSTADCTYMLLGKKCFEFSWRLGASFIEKNMTHVIIDDFLESHKTNEEFASNLDYKHIVNIENDMRIQKEAYYNGVFNEYGHPIICTFFLKGKKEPIYQTVNIDSAFLDRATKNTENEIVCNGVTVFIGSWQDACRAFMQRAKDEIKKLTYIYTDENGNKKELPCEYKNIILTGGASRMDFVASICEEVFEGFVIHDQSAEESENKIETKYPAKEIFKDQNPSKVVSTGLGWTAVSDIHLPECIDSARSQIVENEKVSISELKTNVRNNVFTYVEKSIMDVTRDWAETQGDTLTQNDLIAKVDAITSEKDFADDLEKIYIECVDNWKKDFADALYEAISTQTGKLFSESIAKGLIIPEDVWKSLQAQKIAITEISVSEIVKNLPMYKSAWEHVKAFFIGADKEQLLREPLPRQKRLNYCKSKVSNGLKNNKDSILKEVDNSFEGLSNQLASLIIIMTKKLLEVIALKRFDLDEEISKEAINEIADSLKKSETNESKNTYEWFWGI